MHELLQTKDVINQMQSTKERLQRQNSSLGAELDRSNQLISQMQLENQMALERIQEEVFV
jgi:predicted RNase H-like nuclease (RuvC/YqgF family)